MFLNSFFQAKNMSAGQSEEWLNERKAAVLDGVQRQVKERGMTKALPTYPTRDAMLVEFLELGLRLHEEQDISPNSEAARQRLEDWKALLLSKTPGMHQFHGVPVHLNFCDPERKIV